MSFRKFRAEKKQGLKERSALVKNGNYPVPNPDLYNMDRAWDPPRDPLRSPADPMMVIRDLPASYVSSWDPDLVRQALLRHVAGYWNGSSLLWESILGDARCMSSVHTRIAALLGQPVTFTPSMVAKNSARADEALAAWRDEFPHICNRPSMWQVLQWALGLGVSIGELRWETETEIWRPYIYSLHPQFGWYLTTSRRYMISTMDGVMEVSGGDGKWLLYTPSGSYRGWMNGAVRAIALPFLIRGFAQRDWARFSEVHGLPLIKATVPAAGDAGLKKRFIEACSQLGQESVIMCPSGVEGQRYDLGLVEATDRSWSAFENLMARCEMSITLAILGQNLTTEVNEGSFAAARVHGDVRQMILVADEAACAHFIYEQIARPFCEYNFGDADLAPWTHFDVSPIEDAAKKSEALRSFAGAVDMLARSGTKFDVSRLAKEYGVPGIPEQSPPVPVAGAGGVGKSGGSAGAGEREGGGLPV